MSPMQIGVFVFLNGIIGTLIGRTEAWGIGIPFSIVIALLVAVSHEDVK